MSGSLRARTTRSGTPSARGRICKKHPADARRRRPRRLVRRRRGLVAQCKKTTSAPHCTLCCGSSTATTDQVRVATIWAGRAFRREAPFAHADASLLQDRRRPRPNPPDTEPLGPIPCTGSSSAPLPRLLLHLPRPAARRSRLPNAPPQHHARR